MRKNQRSTFLSLARVLGSTSVLLAGTLFPAFLQSADQPVTGPWTDKTLSPDKRADLLLEQLTLDEKLALVHGGTPEAGKAAKSLGGAGWIPGVPRLGIPDFQMTDGRSGVANIGSRGRYATALPSSLAAGATWDPALAYDYGVIVGREVRDLGFNVSLGGTANLIREPRNGRNFECWSEDPLVIGKMLGRELKGTQDQGVIADINRYAVNDQETGRMVYNAIIDRRSLWETDLLAFQIAIQESDVGTVMCAYNKLNGEYACENPYLMDQVLKKDWAYKGWVMSDWGAAHSTVSSALAGFDQEMPSDNYYGLGLKAAIENGKVPVARLNDMVHRILRTAYAVGIYDNPPVLRPVDPFPGAAVAQRVAEQGMVLLKNAGGQLPLKASAIQSIAVIGSHADAGVLSGGGSDQVDAAGGNAVPSPGGRQHGVGVWHPSPPLNAIRAKAAGVKVEYDPGTDIAAARKLAAASGVVIVFGNQRTHEGGDVENLSLPDKQDELIAQVAAANPHVIVVLETGGPVTMPWLDKVNAVLEAWYPGIRGGEAIANILFGDVNPSGKLPVTFPRSEADLPHPVLPGPPAAQAGAPAGSTQPDGVRAPEVPFDVTYNEGLKVGYKWFDAEDKQPLFPFGFGLSYTTYAYSGLKAAAGPKLQVTFTVTNTGKRAGAEVAQVYVSLPAETGEPPKRLVAWQKVPLAPGESKSVSLAIDRQYLSIFSVGKQGWELVPGEYRVHVGGSSRSTPLSETVHIAGALAQAQ
jgi:beta-glucosidase